MENIDIFKESPDLGSAFARLVKILRILRAPDGCPWDSVQTHVSLKRPMIEEAYEAVSAIDNGDMENLCEELGDVLFSAVNVSRFLGIDSEKALYDACDKFIGRFTKVEALANERGIDMKTASLEQLNSLWDEVKYNKMEEN